MLNSYAKINVPLYGYMAFARPINVVALAVRAVTNPMTFICPFLKLSSAFTKHKNVCSPFR